MLSQHGLLGAGLFCVRIKEKRNSFILCCTGKNFYIVAQQNSDLGGNRFGFTADGEPGYKKAGADTVYPFFNFKLTYMDSRYNGVGSPTGKFEIMLPVNSDYPTLIIAYYGSYASGAPIGRIQLPPGAEIYKNGHPHSLFLMNFYPKGITGNCAAQFDNGGACEIIVFKVG